MLQHFYGKYKGVVTVKIKSGKFVVEFKSKVVYRCREKNSALKNTTRMERDDISWRWKLQTGGCAWMQHSSTGQ